MDILCLFLPPLISIFIFNHYLKDNNLFNYTKRYVILNLIVNFTILLISKIIFKLNDYLFTISFSIKYIILSLALTIIYSYIYLVIKKKLLIKDLLKNIKKYYLKSKRIIDYLIVFIIEAFLFLLFDISLRIESYKLTSFVKVYDIFPLLLTLSYVLIIWFFSIILPKIWAKILVISSYILSLILYITHYMMLIIKQEAFTFYDLNIASEGFEYLNFIIKEINFKFIFVVLLSLGIVVFLIIYLSKLEKLKVHFYYFPIVIIVVLIIRFIGFCTLEDYDDYLFNGVLYPKYYYNNYINPKKSLSISGLYEYTVKDCFKQLKEKNTIIDYTSEIDNYLKNHEKNNSNKYTGLFKDKNIIMIMLESIDHLMTSTKVMPTYNYMKNNGFDFTKRYSQLSSGGSTIATEFTSLTGLFYTGSIYNSNNNHYNYSLPNMFNLNNYQTNVIHENTGTYYNRDFLHNSLGFSNRYYVLDHNNNFNRYNDPGLVSNNDIYKQIVNKGNKEKFMSYIITISAHGPYVNNYACSFDEIASSSEKDCVVFLAKRTDEFLRLLLERLKNDNLLDDTVIVLYSDHYAYGYNYGEEEKKLYEKVDDNRIIQNLPFVIYNPLIKHKVFNNTVIDDIDILPTILNLFEFDYDANEYLGTDIFSTNHENIAIFTDYSWYDGTTYSFNKDVDKNSDTYKNNSSYTSNLLDINTKMISSDYYKK